MSKSKLNGDRKRPKRKRPQGSSGSGTENHGRIENKRTPKRNDKCANDSNEGHQNNKRRIYHGVCPDVSNRYHKIGDGNIGKGTYGIVYCARDTWKESFRDDGRADGKPKNSSMTRQKEEENEVVALKKCYAHHESSDGFPITTLREIHALRICSSHPNIVNLLEVAVSGGKNTKCSGGNENANEFTSKKQTIKIGRSSVYLAFEHCRYDLAKILDSYHEYRRKSNRRNRGSFSRSPFNLSQTKTLTIQLLSALEFCHKHGIVHRDVKTSNLLYTDGRLKVCDFGLSRCVRDRDAHMTPNVVSLWYRAPEVLLSAFINEKYSFPVDLWASGCVVAELIDGQAFLTGTSEIDQLDKIESALGPPPSHLYVLPKEHARIKKDITNRTMGMWDRFEQLPPEGLKFLSQLLDYDPKRRLTAAMALKVSFLDAASVPPPIKDLRTMPRYFPGC